MLYSCSSNTSRRDIDYNEEFEKGKAALSKKKYIKAQDHFNTVVIGASHTELGDDALFYLGESFFLEKNHLLHTEGLVDSQMATLKYLINIAIRLLFLAHFFLKWFMGLASTLRPNGYSPPLFQYF